MPAADPTSEAQLAALARAGGRLGIDTEFVSERRYQALLCLVQVAVPDPEGPDGVRIEVLDPIEGLNPGPLASVLADPAVEVVLHAGRQDVALLRRMLATEVTNVFDTQIAAAFAGYGTQVGYADLVARVLGVRVARSEALTRWDLRPLSAEQLAYARTDVVHLLALADALAGKLAGRGRLEWARQECRALEESTDERNEEVLYERLPRLGGLSGQGRAVARALVRWRDETARALDRPAGWPLPDRVLVEVAKRAPRTRGELEAIRGLPEQTLHRRHRELLAAVEQGRAAEPLPQVGERVDTDPTDAPLVALAGAVLRHEAAAAGLAPELIATQADLARLVARARRGTEGPPIRTLEGWRGELVGEELLALLAGRRRVRVDPRTGLVVEPDDGAAPGGPADPSAPRGGQPQAALEREDVGRRGADAAPDDG